MVADKITLYDYQKEGVRWILKRGRGFLWDEPGLGKTIQAIVAARKLGGPVLVVCPNSLKGWWRSEIRKLFPNDSVITAGVGGRFPDMQPLRDLAQTDKFPWWTIVHYTGLRINTDEFNQILWKTVVCDECHYIKNRKAKRTKAVKQVTPIHANRIGLTATPFSTNPADMWSQLRWMEPHVQALRSYWRFYDAFVDYELVQRGHGKYRQVKGGKNLKQLAKVMSGFGIRRTKKVVAPQLPPIIDTHMPLDLEGKQRDTYNKLKKKTAVEFEFPEGDDDSSTKLVIPNALARMTRLEQWLSHPWTYVSGTKGVKLQWLTEWAEGFNYPAVVATRFKAAAKRIAKEIDARHAITGDISVEAREAIMKDWKDGKHQFLVGTIDTIGTGLNLERAHALVCYGQVYSTISMEQVRQRVHRITTDHPVQVIYLACEGTTNDIVLNSFINNWRMVETVRHFLQHIQEDNGQDQD
jgi:SNF2 family DNA or RNA helicase